jgi:hypothetical protein
MSICQSSEFWISFCANALSDILFGVVFGSLFGIISTKLVTNWIDYRNAPNLYLKFRKPSTNDFYSPLQNWPPANNIPSTAEFECIVENSGKVAATNWLMIIEFRRCSSREGIPLVEFYEIRSSNARYTPLVEIRREDVNGGQEKIRLQYASPADIIHSGYKAKLNLVIGVRLHKGFEEVLPLGLSKRYYTKNGSYQIYADQINAKEGKVTLVINKDTQKVSFDFDRP